MRIRLWNAFASNNSGSYTIVGSFRDPTTASAVAAEFAELCRAEATWRTAEPGNRERGSPLRHFEERHGLPAEERDFASDDWPEYGPAPTVAAAHQQVVVHVPYTVTMPRVFGLHIYARGGRVDVEMDHAHHPIVTDCTLFAPWSSPDRDQRVADLRHELSRDDGLLRLHKAEGVEPVLVAAEWGSHAFRAIAVFTDLPVAVAALASVASRHGCELRVRLFEAEAGDPLKAWR